MDLRKRATASGASIRRALWAADHVQWVPAQARMHTSSRKPVRGTRTPDRWRGSFTLRAPVDGDVIYVMAMETVSAAHRREKLNSFKDALRKQGFTNLTIRHVLNEDVYRSEVPGTIQVLRVPRNQPREAVEWADRTVRRPSGASRG